MLVGPPKDFLLGDLNVDVEQGCLYENGVAFAVCFDAESLKAVDAIFDCGFIHRLRYRVGKGCLALLAGRT